MLSTIVTPDDLDMANIVTLRKRRPPKGFKTWLKGMQLSWSSNFPGMKLIDLYTIHFLARIRSCVRVHQSTDSVRLIRRTNVRFPTLISIELL